MDKFKRGIQLVVGVAFVIGATPALWWYAGEKDTSGQFVATDPVASTVTVSGYVVVEGEAENSTELVCPQSEEDCVYVETKEEVYRKGEVKLCGEPGFGDVVLRDAGEKCELNGTSCTSCYMVEDNDWQFQNVTQDQANFSFGAYHIEPQGGGIYTKPVERVYYEREGNPEFGDRRYQYKYIPTNSVHVVAGVADEQAIIQAGKDDAPFIVSNLNYADTVQEVVKQERINIWGLRISAITAALCGIWLVWLAVIRREKATLPVE